MRKLILEEWISLDGYTSDSDGKLDFFAPYVRLSYECNGRMQFRERIEIILFGSRTYTQFAKVWPGRTAEENILAAKMNSARKVVFSSGLSSAPWGTHAPAEIVSGDAAAHVSQLKSAGDGTIVVWGSVSLAQQLINANLVDEYIIHICPLRTGGGQRLFADNLPSEGLNLVGMLQYGPGIVMHHYSTV